MVTTISQNVPICPACKAMMHKRHYGYSVYFICADCKSIWKVLDEGKAEIELVISDNQFDTVKDFYIQGHEDGANAVITFNEMEKEENDG